ncbi:hypothetical protein ESCO_004478 [Escovopsis weberi]|uniref:Major facilitator superfamily transporter n=1 Tax=Escovopsis weberi TaxID=150374 RepID=A0A0M8N5R1_ESCWE|nr:hypothetical protein ESCO_004478 [Escovopsis weberi]
MDDETSPLLAGTRKPERSSPPWRSRLNGLFDVENRIMAVGFLLCLSFSYTQVPMLYAFHLMACDEYYDHHPPFEGPEDKRCSIDAIAAETAKQFTMTGMSTTFCGIANLFLAGWAVKKVGPRAALMVQTFVPAIRVFVQIMGVIAGKGLGILIIQLSQIITVVGGPSGYILVTNIIVGELVESSRRTSVFGKLQGSLMLGQGIGYLAGGMIGDAFGVRAPFDLAFYNFFLAGFFVWFALPYISPKDMNNGGKDKKPTNASSGFFAPLKILSPQKVRTADGTIKTHYGVAFLCAGIFIGVLSTDYAPLLIQMYATAAFDFGQADNGWLMSEFSLMRSIFLIVIFPHQQAHEEDASKADCEIGHFDLVFLRWSLVIDGAMTAIAALATEKWHIYVAAALLPFGSGSAPAAKGVITDMCPESQRADALNAVTLVESIARLSTQGLFGFIFSSLAGVGKAYATFYCNAGSTLVEKEDEDEATRLLE